VSAAGAAGGEGEVATFRDEPVLAIAAYVADAVARVGVARLRVLDPDRARGLHPGEPIELDGVRYLHRPLRAWLDLADRLRLRLATPRPGPAPFVELELTPLAAERRRERTPRADGAVEERYGADSPFARLGRFEEPGLALDLVDALDRVGLAADARVLALGVGRGDELGVVAGRVAGLAERGDLVGVDHSASALAVARARWPRGRFVEADLGGLGGLAGELGRFDLVVSLATMQSAGIDDRALLRTIVQDLLAPRGALILGLPNCAYQDGELLAGARVKNFRQAELGLVVKDAAFYRKYLQQHARTVYVTGSHELLITAVARG
jgi:hypothetical protein